jgi:hypothetical protein
MKWVSHSQILAPLTATTTHADPGPFGVVVRGFPPHQDAVGSLPLREHKKLVVAADFIADSLRPASLPVLSARFIGHADTDTPWNPEFEHDISVRRARNVQRELRELVSRACPPRNPQSILTDPFHPPPHLIDWGNPWGVGAHEPDAENARRHKTPANMTEDDRRRNRRVEVILEPAAAPVPTPSAEQVASYIWCVFEHNCPRPYLPPPPPPGHPRTLPKFPDRKNRDKWREFVKAVKDALDFLDVKTVMDAIQNVAKPPDPDWRDDFLKEWYKLEEQRRRRQDHPPRRGTDPIKNDDDEPAPDPWD